MPRKHKMVLTTWGLKGRPPSEVVRLIKKQPPNLRPWLGRIIWWDRLSEGDGVSADTDLFADWLSSRNDPEPDPEALAEALVALGYTEKYARMRAGAQAWDFGPRKYVQKTKPNPPPEGLEFPVQYGNGIAMYRISNGADPARHGAVIYQMRDARKRRCGRHGSIDYWKTHDMCLSEARRRENVSRAIQAESRSAENKHEA